MPATLVPAYVTMRSWFDLRTASIAMLLCAFSPLATAMGRRALADPLASLLVVTALALFEHARVDPRRRFLVALGAVLTAALLTKEGLCFVWPAFAGVALVHWRQGRPVPRSLLLPFLAAPIVTICVLVFFCGGLGKLGSTYSAYVAASEKIPYANQFQRGAWFRYLVDLVLLNPIPLLSAVAGVVAPSKRNRDGALVAAGFLLPSLAAFSALSMLNVRFILSADVVCRGLAAVAISRIADWFGRNNPPNAIPITLLAGLALVVDVHQFNRIFVQGQVYDPVTAELVRANGFVRSP